MNIFNLILNADSYKTSHFQVLPEGTTNMQSYIEARVNNKKIMFYGLQIFLKEYLTKPITQNDIEEAESFLTAHGVPFNRKGWQIILDEFGGYLPVEIKAVAEGLVIPSQNVLLTIEATDPRFAWIVQYLETSLLRAVWYGSTVATQSFHIRQTIKNALLKSGDVSLLPFKCHDFGGRGVSSFESAGIAASAHLAAGFMGSDTMTGALYARKYYGEQMAAFSICATEHSISTSYGRDKETDYFRTAIEVWAKNGQKLFATVADTYNIHEAVDTKIGKELRDLIIESGATLVVRPDSGDPERVVLYCLESLGKSFGFTMNDKGFRVLNPAVRIIQGDGMNKDTIRGLYENMMIHGWSADNVAVGSGGALLQGVNRDTDKWAQKACWVEVNGQGYDIFKDPITDQGKRSKKGRLTLLRSKMNGEYMTANEGQFDTEWEEILKPVFRNGELLKEYTFSEVRQNAQL